MNFATKTDHLRILVWLLWFIVLLVAHQPMVGTNPCRPISQPVPLLGIVSHRPEDGSLFPWQPLYRWKKRALAKYRAWRQAYRRAKWAARWARLALSGAITLAQLVDWLTVRQQAYQVGALPVLYALLETLQVRSIINRHCPSRRQVDHGTVALVLVLNRLMFPLPLYRIADWVGQTVLVHVLGIPAAKFNDDRLERTLDALSDHLDKIWLEIVEKAMLKADIDLSVIFYDLSAFVAHGRYAGSEQVDFGFAHNTPMNKRKFKMGLNATADGSIPWLYTLLSGRTADHATVESNMNKLAHWLRQHGYATADTLVVSDRAMLDAETAHAYDRNDLHYLSGLRAAQKEHQALLTAWTSQQFYDYPLEPGPDCQYWGRGCTISFEHEGKIIQHRGLVVLSGPMRDQWQQARRQQLDRLGQTLTQLQAKIGQPYYRTVKAIQRSANARCKESKVGHLMRVEAYQTDNGQVGLRWQIDSDALRQVEERDGRYLLVTNDWSLSLPQMFTLYRQKDGVEKCFHICKSDLKVSPIYLHHDKRIAAMLLLNMIALLAYTLLQRQVRPTGLQLTTRQLIQRLEKVTLIETHCHDGSSLRRLTPIDPEVALILELVATALADFMASPAVSKMRLLPTGSVEPPPLILESYLC